MLTGAHSQHNDQIVQHHVLLPQFLSAFPYALPSALCLPSGERNSFVENSSTNTNRSRSTPGRSQKEPLASSSRSVAPADLSCRDIQASLVAPGPSSGLTPQPRRLLLPHPAVAALHSGGVVLFKLALQSLLLIEGREDTPLSSREGTRREILVALLPHSQRSSIVRWRRSPQPPL